MQNSSSSHVQHPAALADAYSSPEYALAAAAAARYEYILCTDNIKVLPEPNSKNLVFGEAGQREKAHPPNSTLRNTFSILMEVLKAAFFVRLVSAALLLAAAKYDSW